MATGANTTPLGRLNTAKSVVVSNAGSSLLKPSYMVQQQQLGPALPPSMHNRSHHQDEDHHQQQQQQQQHQMMMMKSSVAPLSFKSMMSAGPPPPPPPLPSQQQQSQYNLQQPVVIPPPTVATPSMLVLCSAPPPPPPVSSQASSFSVHVKREMFENDSNSNDSDAAAERERKRRRRSTRWATDDQDKAFIPGMPPVLPNNLSKSQEKAYLLQLQIEELSRRLRVGDLGILPNPEERSPSPEPIYNNEGKRLNTREYRTRKKLEDERHQLIQQMYDVNPEFKPPADYKPPIVRVNDKVMIPQEEHPDINFVGLLIGPRGNTLKSMEKDTGAKIIIRGKGSVKEGKVGRKDGQLLPGEDEPLHAYVTANNLESVKKAVERIKEIIRQGVEVPEGQNDLRRMQLRELALLNGTLRENESQLRCSNCGANTHKSWQCPDKPNVTNNVICTSCGSAGHIAKDCRDRRLATMQGQIPQGFATSAGMAGFGGVGAMSGSQAEKSKIDEEYMSLMAELGEGPPPPIKSTMGGSVTHAGLFGGQQGMQRAICVGGNNGQAAVGGVATNPTQQSAAMQGQPQSQSQQPPPALHFSNHVDTAGASGRPSMSQSVPPPWNQAGPGKNPAQMPQNAWQMQQHGQYMGPPPGMMGQPPPGSWMQQQQATGVQGWQQQGTVMAPSDYRTSPWAGFVGVPPPPPPPIPGHGQQSQQQQQQQNTMAQAGGLPSFLAAAPPPPPPPPS